MNRDERSLKQRVCLSLAEKRKEALCPAARPRPRAPRPGVPESWTRRGRGRRRPRDALARGPQLA